MPTIYHEFKGYGRDAIDDQVRGVPPIQDPDSRQVVDATWSAYKRLSGVQLSTLTHKEGTPWWTAWHDEGGSRRRGYDIRDDLIKGHYRERFKQGNEQP